MKTNKLLLLLAATTTLSAATPWISGCFPTYREKYLTQLNLSKVTYLTACFANPDSSGTLTIDMNLPAFTNHCVKNGVKPIVSIGGGGSYSWGKDTTIYKHLYADTNRTAFVNKLVTFADTNNLVGIDVDIEGPAMEMPLYDPFVCELADSLHAHGKMITAAYGVSQWSGAKFVDDSTLHKLDLINTMTYGGVGSWNWNKPSDDARYQDFVDDMNYFKNRGVTPSKIGGGVPFYGYGFAKVKPTDYNGYYSSWATEYSTDSFYIKQDPFHHDTLINHDSMPEFCNSFPTIKKKLDFAEQFGGGMMIWELGQDNFSGSGPNMMDSISVYLGGTTSVMPLAEPKITVGSPVSANLYGMNGRLIRTIQSGSMSIENLTTGLPAGAYVVRFIDSNGIISVKSISVR